MCVLLAAPEGKDNWQVERLVEVLGFHRSERSVRVLTVLFIQNHCRNGEESEVLALHRGKVESFATRPWPNAAHPDQTSDARPGRSPLYLYERLFCLHQDGKLIQKKELNPGDSMFPIPDQEIQVWPPASSNFEDVAPFDPSLRISPDTPKVDSEWQPFTTWRIARFSRPGRILMTFVHRYSGETYDELVGSESSFTIDGPESLLAGIEGSDLPQVPPNRRADWQSRLVPFKNPDSRRLPAAQNLDIILLSEPYADCVEKLTNNGIDLAPDQPHRKARRYKASSLQFSLCLKYKAKAGALRAISK